MVLSIKF